ncbi:type VI secretion system protein TssA [Enterobacteriaceae bacterium 4M9]|nr:type VI secretion system protein TssA [Enterobacteriaceae bacterium 4M9]
MTTEHLLAPVSAENSCGANLEYDAEFMKLEQLAAGKPEQQFGDTIIPAEAPDWAAVERTAVGLFSRTKDLRVMFYLTLAWTQVRGLQGYADGLQLIYQAIERYWHALYPQLESEGERDPFFRINALAWLGDSSQLTQAVRGATLFKSSGSELSLRDACALLDGSKQELPGYPDGLARLRNELSNPHHASLAVIDPINDTLGKLRHAIHLHLGDGALADMTLLTSGFSTLTQAIASARHTQTHDAEPDLILSPEVRGLPDDTLTLPPVEFGFGQVQSRADAIHLLEKVKDYFVRYEPSHPAPLMIERLQKVINLNFLQIVSNLAPDGLRQLETLFGTGGKDNES